MASCHVCGKKRSVGNNVSHANNRTKRQILPNLQRTKIDEKGAPMHVHVCTRCLRSKAVKKVV